MPSLLEAIECKYGSSRCRSARDNNDEDGNNEGISVAIYVPRRPARTTVPSLLVLNNCDITTAGGQRELAAAAVECARVEELDLASNKLSDWTEVFGIVGQMPRLRFVNLSFNRLSTPMRGVSVGASCWPQQLGSLVLNATQVDWSSVRRLLGALPSLEELHLSMNGYNEVDLGIGEHTRLRRLHFAANPVSHWSQVCRFGRAFPCLDALVLANCPIRALEADNAEPHESFDSLELLNLNGTLLGSWDDVERLARFPALHSLRVQGCALWDAYGYTEHERRQLLVARLPNVRTLNGGGVISAREREDAERAFIRYYMDRPEADRPARYAELVAVHGRLEPLADVDLRPEKRVRVTFSCGERNEVRSVDVHRTVSDLKHRLETFAGMSAANMRLFYVDRDLRDIHGPEEMKYPHKRLYSYNIQTSDEIIIDCKRGASKRDEAASAVAAVVPSVETSDTH